VGVGHLGQSGDVGHPQQGVAGRLQPDHAGFGAQGSGHLPGVRGLHEGESQAVAAQHFVEQAKGAAVDIIPGDHMVAGVQQTGHGVDGRHA